MKVSLVIPTYKKEKEVLDQLERLYGYLSRKNPNFELIFVIDGYVDNTKSILEEYIKTNRLKKAKVVGYEENRGKGFAVRYGMKRATGDVIGFTDADRDIYLRTLGDALKEISKDDVYAVIPSKFHKDSNLDLAFERKILALGLTMLNKAFLNLPKGITDVGCGLKLFKKEVVKRILPQLTVDRFAIDSDILNALGQMGIPVRVIPFYLSKSRSDSTSANVKESLKMLKDITFLSYRGRVKKVFYKNTMIDTSKTL